MPESLRKSTSLYANLRSPPASSPRPIPRAPAREPLASAPRLSLGPPPRGSPSPTKQSSNCPSSAFDSLNARRAQLASNHSPSAPRRRASTHFNFPAAPTRCALAPSLSSSHSAASPPTSGPTRPPLLRRRSSYTLRRLSSSNLRAGLHPNTDPTIVVGGVYKIRCSTFHPLLDMLSKLPCSNPAVKKRIADQLREKGTRRCGKYRPCVVTSVEDIEPPTRGAQDADEAAPTVSATDDGQDPSSDPDSEDSDSAKAQRNAQKRVTVCLLATFDKCSTAEIPSLILHFLVPIYPTLPPPSGSRSSAFTTIHTEPEWPDQPQWIVAYPLVLPEKKSIVDVWWNEEETFDEVQENPMPKFEVGEEQMKRLVEERERAYKGWVEMDENERNRMIIEFLNMAWPSDTMRVPCVGIKRQPLTSITNCVEEVEEEEGWTTVSKKESKSGNA
ncbi:hypothetical protein AX16_006539 [Volvariella volvacea WC 439]|nr:hypothetical protein AX16_006539 [Volvariella volvacea WC 439]